MSEDFQLTVLFNVFVAGPSIPPAVSYTKRPQANSVESEQKDEWDKDLARKLGSTTVGSKSEMTASPLVGPERKKSSTIPSVSECPGTLHLVSGFFVQSLKLYPFLKTCFGVTGGGSVIYVSDS